MAGRLEGIGIATLLVSLALVALPCAHARPLVPAANPAAVEKTRSCVADLSGPDYVAGVDVSGNRIAPADIGGGSGVDLSRVSATPILTPGRHGRHVEIVLQGAEPAKSVPPCKWPSR